MSIATGSFDVTVEPIEDSEEWEGISFSSMSLTKEWKGGFTGTSTGRMLTAGTMVDGKMSAGYVAVERMKGSLDGRHGAFVFQHAATMDRAEQQLTVSVVPDSGSGELRGIRGSLTIEVDGDEHRYSFDYSLPETD